MKIFAETLSQKGWAFLPFNNRGAHYVKKFRLLPEKTEEVMQGTWMEKIADAQFDIQAAVEYVQSLGFEDIVLIGESSGANKICVYNDKHPANPVKGYALVGGGDDTGLWSKMLGENFTSALESSKTMVARGRGGELTDTRVSHQLLSYQSLLDTIDPDGEYNVFPFLEASGQAALSTKPLFHCFAKITKPTLALYGSLDPFCVVPAEQAVAMLRDHFPKKELFTGVVSEGADHSFEGKEREEAEAILDWIINLKL